MITRHKMAKRRKKEIRHKAGDGIHHLPNGQTINMRTVDQDSLKLFAERFPSEFIIDFPQAEPDPVKEDSGEETPED